MYLSTGALSCHLTRKKRAARYRAYRGTEVLPAYDELVTTTAHKSLSWTRGVLGCA